LDIQKKPEEDEKKLSAKLIGLLYNCNLTLLEDKYGCKILLWSVHWEAYFNDKIKNEIINVFNNIKAYLEKNPDTTFLAIGDFNTTSKPNANLFTSFLASLDQGKGKGKKITKSKRIGSDGYICRLSSQFSDIKFSYVAPAKPQPLSAHHICIVELVRKANTYPREHGVPASEITQTQTISTVENPAQSISTQKTITSDVSGKRIPLQEIKRSSISKQPTSQVLNKSISQTKNQPLSKPVSKQTPIRSGKPIRQTHKQSALPVKSTVIPISKSRVSIPSAITPIVTTKTVEYKSNIANKESIIKRVTDLEPDIPFEIKKEAAIFLYNQLYNNPSKLNNPQESADSIGVLYKRFNKNEYIDNIVGKIYPVVLQDLYDLHKEQKGGYQKDNIYKIYVDAKYDYIKLKYT